MPSEASSRRRGRGPQPAQRRGGRGLAANPAAAARRRRADDRLRAGYSRVVHFDVPAAAGGREVISVDWRGERPESGRVPGGGLTVFVALGRDGRYSADGLRGRFDTIDELLHAFGACWPSPCAVPAPSKEQHMDEPASAHTLQKLDVLSLEDSNNGPPGCRLSSSPIWNRSVFDWGITFYTTSDRTGSFHTYPDVGGPFQSLDEVNSAIDQYLIDNQDPTMCAGLSQVDAIVKRVRYYPDGTKARGAEVKDKRRDKYYQLARALVHKYNDDHNLLGDLAYEVKDFLHGKPLWEDYYIHWTYFHMNFTAKTKGSDGVDTGNLFFAEVKCTLGDDALTVNSCCILEPSDHGLCYGCCGDVKHPNDGNAYASGRRNISYRFQNGSPELPPDYCVDRYYEDSDEEVERLRSQFMEELKPLPMPLVV